MDYILKDKRVLLIIPKYFGYEKVIKKSIEGYGAFVDSIYENISELSPLYDFAYYHMKNYAKKYCYRYYVNKINSLKPYYDYVLVVRGWSITNQVIDYMKNKYDSNTKFILWQWDSVENNKNVLDIYRSFDKTMTFDFEDSKKYGWIYRPDFYVNDYVKNQSKKSIDLMFIGSYSEDRYDMIKHIKKASQELGFVFKNYMYIKRKNYLYLKYVKKNNLDKTDFIFKSLDLDELYKLYGKCKVVVEHVSNTQSGLTMRPLDCMANMCKLVTNNKYIEQVDFFNENNILVYDEIDKLDIKRDFINSDYIEMDEDIKSRYSLNTWVEDIFDGGI